MEWYENGKKAVRINYVNGIIKSNRSVYGKYEEWYVNGKKSLIIYYKDGQENGTWKQWYENGKREMTIEYVNGVAWGKAKFWLEDGTLQGEGIIKYEIPGGGWLLEEPEGEKRFISGDE